LDAGKKHHVVTIEEAVTKGIFGLKDQGGKNFPRKIPSQAKLPEDVIQRKRVLSNCHAKIMRQKLKGRTAQGKWSESAPCFCKNDGP
jgi:hypothetical protein